ncbi:hypothetical protein [Phenylobacterium sp.]|uniref:hypothetical protein n=1 Tax=Phenylobacterium sp. TaxID=1871053 RepID=UPI0035AE7F64
MGVDYGLRPRRRPARLYALLAGGFVLVGLAGFAAWEVRDWLGRREAAVETAKAWDVQGPPCPELSEAEFRARGLKAPKAFEFEGVVIARRHGHVSCQMVADNAGRSFSSHVVCQFTGPGVLRVTAPGGERRFEAGPGQPATVSTEGGAPRCVLASKFRLEGGRLTYS